MLDDREAPGGEIRAVARRDKSSNLEGVSWSYFDADRTRKDVNFRPIFLPNADMEKLPQRGHGSF